MQAPFGTEQGAGESTINLVDLVDQPAWKTILIDLVKSNKMNPWDIDLTELANKYFQKIQALEKADLKLPANAILASTILLKFKARAISISSIEDEDETTKEMTKEEIQFFEQNIPELRHGRQLRTGKITLDELVSNIEAILEKTKQRGNILREKEIPEFKLSMNQPNIEKKIEETYLLIQKKADSQGITRFSQLITGKNPVEMVNVFIPMLFLTNKGKINIWQEEFWREIFIALQSEGTASVKLPEKE
ncbi:MAG: segregation/condensation protein A [Candidatus ainarchaeum sp.]|nr:segregation/condensation protein A [Candidatus ainarchaeum sp.]